MLVGSALPLHTPCCADLLVRFCDGREDSIADASELHESGSPQLLFAVGTSDEPSITAPTKHKCRASSNADLCIVIILGIR